MSGYRYHEVYSQIGAPLNLSQIRRLRFWPVITGSLRAPLIFGVFKFLGVSSWWSLAFSIFVATDQALIAESRFVSIDSVSHNVNLRQWLAVMTVGIVAGSIVAVKFTEGGVALTVVLGFVIRGYPLAVACFLHVWQGSVDYQC
jgi:dolichyl-phosphate-mannose--protein O-mannosyl transferase